MSKINGIGVGVPYGTYKGTGYITDSSTFYAPLESSLILSKGTGNPTWSRATAAWRFNELGFLQSVPSGCAVFGGARLVRNLCPTPSNTLAVSGTKTVTLSAAATLQFSMGAGTGTATFSGTGGATGTLEAGSVRVSVNKSVTAGTFIVTASVADLVDLQIADVTGYASTYVPEYVSVGVVATPFFGAGIDGAKYFTTDQYGAPLSAASLLKFRRESAATNNLLWNRDLTQQHNNTYSGKRWQVQAATGSELVTNSSFDSGLTNWTTTIGSGGSITAGGGQCTFVSDGGTGTSIVNSATLTSGATYILEIGIASGSGTLKFANGTQEISALGVGVNTISFVAVGTNITVSRTSAVACNLVIDYVSIKLASVQCSLTATGLDGIANTATTLTAAATDATILQTITLASAARCASAYVRRKTGTGTISFTQDGGSTWTDITSSLNTSTFTRVEITSTLANPSVGFKISTSGDAIEVDGVMNEAGSVATSLILTTTAAVTRNADVLSYQTASNIDFSVGTAVGSVYSPNNSVNRNIITVGSGSGNSYISVGRPDTAWRAYDGTTVVEKTGLSSINTGTRKRVISWGGAGLKCTGDGLTPASGTFDGTFGNGATIEVGQTLGGYVGDIAIYNYQMTDAEHMSITT